VGGFAFPVINPAEPATEKLGGVGLGLAIFGGICSLMLGICIMCYVSTLITESGKLQ
jgi:hypothetical protein